MRAFDFPATVVEAFTHGDCWALACEIKAVADLPLVVLLQSAAEVDRFNWFHIGNRLPDGSVVDVEGVWAETEWVAHWMALAFSARPVVTTWSCDDLLDEVEGEPETGEPQLLYPEVDSRRWAYEVVTQFQ